ncbi:hypothetical protein [Mycoplana ramosa]|uniref:Uncharacterized protein n=1 Tax=Mycoplana ramosa TaxID=40837 RepID=A0ABW3Z157_MYCRA
MLPRLAMQVTVSTPLPDPTTEGGQRPVLSAEALANLRAALVLRLLEAMMRQIGQRGDKGNVAHQLLDVLFAAMKTMPPRDGKDDEPAKRLAILLSRLPSEMRPSIERLLTTALSVASTRVLMEIIRNPGGRDAQRLAQALLAATTETATVDRALGKVNPRFAGLEAQLAASSRNFGRDQHSGATNPGAGDSRALQAALRRMFEAGAQAQPSPGRSRGEPGQATTLARMAMQASVAAGTGTQGAASALQVSTHGSFDGARLGFDAARAAEDRLTGQSLLDADAGDRQTGKANSLGRPPEHAANSAAVNAPAVGARASQESVQRLIAGLIANLTDGEALVLRLLLEAPLPEAPDAVNQSPLPEPAIDDPAADRRAFDAKPGATDRPVGNEPGPPRPLPTEDAGDDAGPAAVPAALREEESVEGPQPRTEQGEKFVRTAANAVPQLDRPLERLPIPLALRDGIGFPVVPHQPAQDDIDSEKAPRPDEGNEEETSDRGGDNQSGDGKEDASDEDQQTQEPADTDPDLARRRSRMEEFVGPPDPGFAFYQRLGEYWT